MGTVYVMNSKPKMMMTMTPIIIKGRWHDDNMTRLGVISVAVNLVANVGPWGSGWEQRKIDDWKPVKSSLKS